MIDLVVDLFATARLTRLVTADSITAPLRDRLIEQAYLTRPHFPGGADFDWTEYAMADADAPKLAVLLTCRFCASVWVAFGVVAARRLAPRAWAPVATALALSSASTLLAGLED